MSSRGEVRTDWGPVGEAGQVGIHDLGVDPESIEQREALLHVDGLHMDVLVTQREELETARLATVPVHDAAGVHLAKVDVLADDPVLLAVDHLAVGQLVLPARRGLGGP